MRLIFLRTFLVFLCGFSLQASEIEVFSPEVMERENDNMTERMNKNNEAIKRIAYLDRVLFVSNDKVAQVKSSPDLIERFLVYEKAIKSLHNVISFASASRPYSAEGTAQSLYDCVDQCMLCFACSKADRRFLAKRTFERKSLF